MAVLDKTQEDFLSSFNWHNYSEGIDIVDLIRQGDKIQKILRVNGVGVFGIQLI